MSTIPLDGVSQAKADYQEGLADFKSGQDSAGREKMAAVGVESLTPCANAQSGVSNKERIEIVGFMGLFLILSNQGLNNKLKNYDKRAN